MRETVGGAPVVNVFLTVGAETEWIAALTCRADEAAEFIEVLSYLHRRAQ